MAILGTFDYPDTTAEDAIEFAKKLAATFKSAEFGRDALAHTLGYKGANSGAFNQRLADLRKFGLVEGRGDVMRTTELARTLAAPGPGEFDTAVAALLFKIPLYKALFDHYQGAVPGDDDFFATLLNLTKADRLEVQKQSGRIKSLFVGGTSRLGAKGSPSEPSPAWRGSGAPSSPPSTAAGSKSLPATDMNVYRSGALYVEIPKDDLELLEDLLYVANGWFAKAKKKASKA